MNLAELYTCIYGRCYHPKCEAETLKGQIHFYRHSNYVFKMQCYNKEEADAIKSYLTEEERKKVFFTWLEWTDGRSKEPSTHPREVGCSSRRGHGP